MLFRSQAYEYPNEVGQSMKELAESVTNLDPDETNRLAELLISQLAQE